MTDMALTVRNMGFDEVMRLGPVLAQSGYFQDAKQASQAIVKVLAGQEMGFGPIASMVGVHIISGKPAPGANLMASAVKRNPHYDYKIVNLDDDACILAFFENGQKVGESSFTAEDAKKAGTKNMDRFPRNMLFARAISNGVRWFCPDVFGGVTAYTPEELGANVDENGDVIDVTPTPYQEPEPTPTPAPAPTNGNTRPLDPEKVRAFIHKKAGWQNGQRRTDGEPATEKQVPKLATDMGELFPNLDNKMRQKARHDVLAYLIGVTSTNDLYKEEASALIDWCKDQANATLEAARIIEAIALEAGQQELPLAPL